LPKKFQVKDKTLKIFKKPEMIEKIQSKKKGFTLLELIVVDLVHNYKLLVRRKICVELLVIQVLEIVRKFW